MKRAKNINRARINLPLFIIALFLFAYFMYQVAYLSLSPKVYGTHIQNFAENRNTKAQIIEPKRGMIFEALKKALNHKIGESIHPPENIPYFVGVKRIGSPRSCKPAYGR